MGQRAKKPTAKIRWTNSHIVQNVFTDINPNIALPPLSMVVVFCGRLAFAESLVHNEEGRCDSARSQAGAK